MSVSDKLPDLTRRVAAGLQLSADDAEAAIGALVSGAVPHEDIAAFLTALAKRGPTAEEIAGGARALRATMLAIEAPEGAIDVCGTGGDGQGTLNVSTAVALVVAACGVPVAKHGNRAMSSRSGSADVLEALGVRIDLAPTQAEYCLRESGICFMFAQTHHPAIKHVAPVRRELGFRTIFNLLGPLVNPARVKRQLVGVYEPKWVVPMAQALSSLGAEAGSVVHGADGVDELSIADSTTVASFKSSNEIFFFIVGPEDAGLPRSSLSELKGGDANENAEAIRALLGGAKGAFRDIVLFNAAAALIVADKADDLPQGVAMAAAAIDKGAAKRLLERFAEASHA
jgi:anthranilate phosphoribosyltransferase